MSTHDEDLREIQEIVTTMFASMTGPISDMTRAYMAAQVDGLLDAHKRMKADGWADWEIAQIMPVLLGSAKEGLGKISDSMGKDKK